MAGNIQQKVFILVAYLLSTAFISCLSFEKSILDEVTHLTSSNFDKLVLADRKIWVVAFYVTDCKYCENLAPDYIKVAKAFKDIASFGIVNCEEQPELKAKYAVSTYPTTKIFFGKKDSPKNYDGSNIDEFVDTIILIIHNTVRTSLGRRKIAGDQSKDGLVVELTDKNFQKTVFDSDQPWLVEFFAPWCGHCKNLEPHFKAAAKQVKGKVKFGALDATIFSNIARKYNVNGYPTLKYFPAGKKSHTSVIDYTGGRLAEEIVNWVSEQLSSVPDPQVTEIISAESFKNECIDKILCVISILPDLLDCPSVCRKEYLEILMKLATKYKQAVWGWVWSEAQTQAELEDSLGIGGLGYPSLVVINSKKKKYSIFRGSFSEKGIDEFLKEVSLGQCRSMPLTSDQLPQITAVSPWDGKDKLPLPNKQEKCDKCEL